LNLLIDILTSTEWWPYTVTVVDSVTVSCYSVCRWRDTIFEWWAGKSVTESYSQ